MKNIKITRKLFIKGMASLAILNFLTACSGGSGGTLENEECGLFETIDLQGIKITFETFDGAMNINPVVYTYFAPKLSIENRTNQTVKVNPETDFRVYYDGVEYGLCNPEYADNSEMLRTIEPGEKIEGFIYFDVPQKSWKEFRMIFEPMQSTVYKGLHRVGI